MRAPTRLELISILCLLGVLAGGGWYMVSAFELLGVVELSTNGQIARALGIGVAILLALVLNIAFIRLARRQTAEEEAEQDFGTASAHPLDREQP